MTSAATLTLNTTPVTSAAPSSYDLDVAIEGAPASTNTINEPKPEPVQRYHIEVPPQLPHTASQRALHEERAKKIEAEAEKAAA